MRQTFHVSGSGVRVHPVFRFAEGHVRTRVYVYFITLGICGRLRQLLGRSGVGVNVSGILTLTRAVIAVRVALPRGGGAVEGAVLVGERRGVTPLFSSGF